MRARPVPASVSTTALIVARRRSTLLYCLQKIHQGFTDKKVSWMYNACDIKPNYPSFTEVTKRMSDLERSPRAPLWQAVPDEQWDDWRWQLSHRLNTAEEIG